MILALAMAIGATGCDDPATTPDIIADTADDIVPDAIEDDGDSGPNDGADTDDAPDTADTVAPAIKVIINEVAPAGFPVDWVEFYNAGEGEADLSGWTLTDSDPANAWAIPAGTTLAPGAYWVVERDAIGSFTFGLGAVDSLKLYDGTMPVDRTVTDPANLMDETQWTDADAPKGTSWGRFPNATGDFMTLVTPTPGVANPENPVIECGDGTKDWNEVCDAADVGDATCLDFAMNDGVLTCSDDCQVILADACDPPTHTVFINEVTSEGDDTIEIYNPSDAEIDLTGWTITDKLGDADAFFLYPGGDYQVPAKGFLVLTKDIDHLFGVGKSDSIWLVDGDGVLVDTVTWAKGDANPSWCRQPDGGETWGVCIVANFGSANGG